VLGVSMVLADKPPSSRERDRPGVRGFTVGGTLAIFWCHEFLAFLVGSVHMSSTRAGQIIAAALASVLCVAAGAVEGHRIGSRLNKTPPSGRQPWAILIGARYALAAVLHAVAIGPSILAGLTGVAGLIATTGGYFLAPGVMAILVAGLVRRNL
jgi:hypothetical protein